MANGEVADRSEAAEGGINVLSASVSTQAEAAKSRLFLVYVTSLAVSAGTLLAGILLVWAALRIIRKYVIAPIRGAMDTLRTAPSASAAWWVRCGSGPGPPAAAPGSSPG